MKRLISVLCLSSLLIDASGQGTINFFNTSSTLVTVGGVWVTPSLMSGAPGSFYFALLTSPVQANHFTFAGVYATNQAVAGRFNGGVGVTVAGWAPGEARDWAVFGWSADLGPYYYPAWLTPDLRVGPSALTGEFIGESGYG